MVRVLSCYHFRGQKIGRCEEVSAVTVAGQSIIVGIDDSINVYSTCSVLQRLAEVGYDGSYESSNKTLLFQIPEIGAPITFESSDKPISPQSPVSERSQQHSGSCASSVSSIESDSEIKLSHSFATVDLVRFLNYNKKGNYLLCLECRDADTGNNKCSCIRVYFHWDRKCDILPMRTRIAGVSPSVSDLEKPSLTMIEVPLTSPAIAVSSCSLSGHLASLSAECIVNIFSFRIKEVSGRSKLHYPDFDRLCAVELTGFAPEKVSFLGNFVSCTGNGKLHVFRIKKSADKSSWSPSTAAAEKYGLVKSQGQMKSSRGHSPNNTTKTRPESKCYPGFDYSNKVTYDPSDETVTVHLPSITRANRKRAGNSVIVEEYSHEISVNKSKIIFSSVLATVGIEDTLRLSLPHPVSHQERFVDSQLYPTRVGDILGGVVCIVGMNKEALSYHLSTKEECSPVRIANYSFTAPLVTFQYDSLFFHVLTESGLETYTSRSLYYALQDHEGFERYRNACPLKMERPCLVGIRPFVKVRFMAASDTLLCLMACPTTESACSSSTAGQKPVSDSLLQEERLWTIYSLELPDIDMLFEDTMRLAKSQEGQADTYLTLLCELHLIIRSYLNSTPDDAPYYTPRYRELCKSIGLEYLKASWILSSQSQEDSSAGKIMNLNQNNLGISTFSSEELLDLGVTYLRMSKMTIQLLFGLENSALTHETQYIQGAVKLIDVLLSEGVADKHNFSPALSSSIVDFLSRNSADTLIDLVIKVPFLRENQSTRLIEILQDVSATQNFGGKERIALILTLVAAGGIDGHVRSKVRSILEEAASEDLVPYLQLDFILERGALTDLTICLTAVNSDLPTIIISDALQRQESSIAEVMLAFAKAVNLNSESQIQRSLAKALRKVLESYFIDKILGDEAQEPTCNPGVIRNDTISSTSPTFNDDERHAVQALVRSYLSDISFSSSKLKNTTTESNTIIEDSGSGNAEVATTTDNKEFCQQMMNKTDNGSPPSSLMGQRYISDVDVVAKNQLFGKIPSFVNFLLNVEAPGGSITPTGTGFSSNLFSSQENMESYIRLLSLLSSPLGKIGVKDSVLNFVYNNSSSVKSTPLQLILLMFCEPVETAISILISRQPTTVLLYAKEMFGKSTSKWKILVTQLKKRINLNPQSADSDMFSTIIESVYLHLANTLTLTELEEVLEKGSDDVAKFRSTCKRVELANSYANMVIQISSEYLQNKQ